MKRRTSKTGQGIVEYVLVTALVALAATVIFRSFQADLKRAYDKAGEALISGIEKGFDPAPDGD